ncbi:sensor histidine kinase [Qiania dongpingensis]|uniref:histidine kinase n=1 Tax=Qiania dongpingensis TaxID=2763669 RepID=A0A7G9G3T9_9FIRM|nr:sensor histidine kinase [Qiania dongpingensis]QNM05471.1 sensor histidine kinase [Qiania dongpingensis]
MKISEYVRDKWAFIGTGVLLYAVAAWFLWMTGTELPVIIMTGILYFSGFAGIGAYDCMQKKRYYDKLNEAWEELEEKSYLTEIIKFPGFYDGKLMYEVIRKNEKYLNDIIADQQAEMMEYKKYVETWVHEIKTPIAVEHLIIENNKSPITSSLEEEVDKVEAYVEQLLYYTKSGSLEGDYMIQPVILKKLVSEAIRKNKKMMVAVGMIPKLENLEYEILTDTKWMGFILGQIITNSVKYSDSHKKPHITFEAAKSEKHMIEFSVWDNGIGIPEGDLSRVFLKGFTGENGRRVRHSTGMGLYLCKSLCDKMEIPLEIHSKCGEGTRINFLFKQN